MRTVLIVILISIISVSGLAIRSKIVRSSDAYLRDHVVKLEGAMGSCSGIEVQTDSKHVYTLTAAHCRVLLSLDGTMTAVDEQGRKHIVSFIAEDPNSDLLLLTDIGAGGIEIASKTTAHELVKTITHGHGLAAYRTDGELIQEEFVQFGEEITTKEGVDECVARGPKASIATDMFGMVTYCVTGTTDIIATAPILPGSSGGPMFDLDGKVVGIVSASSNQDMFGRFVRLKDIQSFLKGR